MEQAKICLKKLEAWGRSCPIFGPPPPTNTASQSENSDTTPSQPSDENRLSADDSNPPAAGTMPYNNDDSAPFVANGNTDTDLLGKTSSFPSHDKRAESDYCGAQQSGTVPRASTSSMSKSGEEVVDFNDKSAVTKKTTATAACNTEVANPSSSAPSVIDGTGPDSGACISPSTGITSTHSANTSDTPTTPEAPSATTGVTPSPPVGGSTPTRPPEAPSAVTPASASASSVGPSASVINSSAPSASGTQPPDSKCISGDYVKLGILGKRRKKYSGAYGEVIDYSNTWARVRLIKDREGQPMETPVELNVTKSQMKVEVFHSDLTSWGWIPAKGMGTMRPSHYDRIKVKERGYQRFKYVATERCEIGFRYINTRERLSRGIVQPPVPREGKRDLAGMTCVADAVVIILRTYGVHCLLEGVRNDFKTGRSDKCPKVGGWFMRNYFAKRNLVLSQKFANFFDTSVHKSLGLGPGVYLFVTKGHYPGFGKLGHCFVLLVQKNAEGKISRHLVDNKGFKSVCEVQPKDYDVDFHGGGKKGKKAALSAARQLLTNYNDPAKDVKLAGVWQIIRPGETIDTCAQIHLDIENQSKARGNRLVPDFKDMSHRRPDKKKRKVDSTTDMNEQQKRMKT